MWKNIWEGSIESDIAIKAAANVDLNNSMDFWYCAHVNPHIYVNHQCSHNRVPL